MLSSVSVGEGLKTRATPQSDAPKTPNCAKKDARDASAAVEALEASLEACLKSAAALGGAAPTGAAARLAAKADRLAKSVAALGDATRKAAPETSDDEAVDAGPRAAPGPSYWDHAREWHSCVNLNAFSNLPEVLAEMAAREDVYRRRPVRVPKASLGST